MGDSVERLTCGLWASLGSQEASFLGWTKDPFLAAVALRKILQLLCMSGSRCPCLLVLRGRRGRGKPGSLLFRGTRGAESDSLVFPPPSASTPPLSIDPSTGCPNASASGDIPSNVVPQPGAVVSPALGHFSYTSLMSGCLGKPRTRRHHQSS